MLIKKFQGATEQEALQLAKQELGKDVIITHINTIKPKGIYRLFKKPMVEITAAVDEERIYEKISGYDAEGDSRVVTELIRRIRKKINQYTEHEYIETIWGMGYKWTK